MTHKIQLGTYTDNPKDEETRRHVARVLCEAVGCGVAANERVWNDDFLYLGLDIECVNNPLASYASPQSFSEKPAYIPLPDFLAQWPMPGQMRLIKSADELVINRDYHCRDPEDDARWVSNTGTDLQKFWESYGEYQIFGPIPEPNWDAVLGEEG